MNVSAASLAPDSSVCKATPSDNTERTARSGAVVETIFLSRPRRAQCTCMAAYNKGLNVFFDVLSSALNLLTVEALMPHFDPVTGQFSAPFGP